jgi:hypothetical protein
MAPLVEVFVMIEEYPKYDISNFGQVRNRHTGRLLKAGENSNGYLHVGLQKDKKKYTVTIHRLVCKAFIDNPNNYKCVDHIDRCKTNNHVSNLRWATYSMNIKNRNSFGKTNVAGVSWSEKSKRYECHITGNNAKRIRKSFSVSRYGNKARALQHARIWIIAMKREHGYL